MYIRSHKGNSLIENLSNYTVLDIETTSLDSRDGEILEISALKVRNKKIVAEFSKLIKVTEVGEFTIHLTGITDEEMRKYGEDIDFVLTEFLAFLGNDIIVGHNINFDINFIYDNLEKRLGLYLDNDFVDTLRLSRMLLSFLPRHRLDDLISYFNLETRNEHRALNDCILTNQVYLKLCDLLVKMTN